MKTPFPPLRCLPRLKRLGTNILVKNVSANIIGGVWTGLLIIIATPWYVSLLGMEGYGLLAFWLLMQIVISLADLGLGASLVREFAASEGQSGAGERRSDFLRTLESIFWPLAVTITAVIFVSAGWMAHHWLKLQAVSPDQAAKAIQWMAFALGMQFPSALYSSGLAGLQKQGRMNLLLMLGNGLRHGGGVAILLWKADPIWFFAWQAVVAAVQTMATRRVLWKLINIGRKRRPAIRWALLKGAWRFSAGMALTVIAGVILANVDRLFLSSLMPAEELGKYSAALTVANLLQLGIQPFYRAYFPRFSELWALGDAGKLRMEYYQGSRMVALIIIPFAVLGMAFAPEIFRAWIGRTDGTIVNVFRLLLVGMGGAGLMWLPAAFQQAQGWTRLHAGMIIGALGFGVPCLWWAIGKWGTSGATAVWCLHGLSDATLGLWLMHRRLLRGEFGRWYRIVALPPLLCSLPIVGLSRWLAPSGLNRWLAACWVGGTGLIVIACLLAFLRLEIVKKGRFSAPSIPS